ncbi:protein TWIN LOV 1 isoform X2 [Citrus clementina]|uniref:protein TWIN LOV 1 isoform X2 n=1 Tax=Citrus clementina TaxID=85681 RepID=UPI000CED5C38|nr:protein TWIN LOV 1 isoform X2 [Citrus x clementina]
MPEQSCVLALLRRKSLSSQGHPIVFASRGFLKMSGFSRAEIIGRNGRMFQGPRTNRRTIMEIREAIREERPIEVNLLNYKKDGTPFWMLFKMSPVFGKEDGRATHFVAVQVPIVSRKHMRNSGMSYSEDGGGSRLREIVFGSCRREVCSDSLLDLDRVLALDSDDTGLEIEDSCEASDLEKRKAATAIDNILSVLTHYSQLTGRLVCGKRCSLPGMGFISSSLYISLGRIKQSFVLIDPHLPAMPMVYASDAFLKLTGYDRNEVVGQNCRFLNGVDTDTAVLYQIKESIQTEQACTVRILNYRKDKSSFWNLLHISPIRNASGKQLASTFNSTSFTICPVEVSNHHYLQGTACGFSIPLTTMKIAYFAAVHTEEGCRNQDRHGLSLEMRQLSAIGAIKVAVRSLSMGAGPSKS